jgi:hypothetical protein
VVSTAIRRFLVPGAVATVLGSSSHAVWLRVDNTALVISTVDATRLPNSIEIAARSESNPFRGVDSDTAVVIGNGSIELGSMVITRGRWWDPHPVLPPTTLRALSDRLEHLPAGVPGVPADELQRALGARSPDALVAAAETLLGRGPGLTPEGDDFMAGALAGFSLLGDALGLEHAVRLCNAVASPLDVLAMSRTTIFSAALIRCALCGMVAAPAAGFLRALAGRGDVVATHSRLTQVGHTSGPALAAGIVSGARALIDGGAK